MLGIQLLLFMGCSLELLRRILYHLVFRVHDLSQLFVHVHDGIAYVRLGPAVGQVLPCVAEAWHGHGLRSGVPWGRRGLRETVLVCFRVDCLLDARFAKLALLCRPEFLLRLVVR